MPRCFKIMWIIKRHGPLSKKQTFCSDLFASGYRFVFFEMCRYSFGFPHVKCQNDKWKPRGHLAAAQNVSRGPTNDPDLWSRSPIQTFPRELIQTFHPDLWNDLIYGRVDVWSSDGSCFLVSCSAVIRPAKQPSNKLLHLLLSHAAKLSNCNCCMARLSINQAV